MPDPPEPTRPALPLRHPLARCRRFALLDAMLAVAVIAVGFVGFKADYQLGGSVLREDFSHMSSVVICQWEKPWYERVADGVGFGAVLAAYLVLAWRLRRPRPPLWRVARQWGTVACLGVVATHFVTRSAGSLGSALQERAGGQQMTVGWGETTFGEQVWIWFQPGPEWAIVLVAWLIAKVGRVGRSEPGWIDRAGRVVGWLLIARCLFVPFCHGVLLLRRG